MTKGIRVCQIIIGLVLGSLLTSVAVMAQETKGAVTGLVRDPTGANVPGAEVAAINSTTGVRYTGLTNDLGIYHIPRLQPGTYNIEVEVRGFKKQVLSGLPVDVDSVVRRDITLEVGEMSQTISVQAEIVSLGTSNPDLGTVVESKMIGELPALDRSFVTLARLGAGAQRPGTFDNHQARLGRGEVSVVISGQREISTSYLFDGIPSNEGIYGSSAQYPALDAISEFKVQRAFFSGEAQGTAVVNVITKSGSNTLHGSAWEFHRNDNLNARSFFDAKKPEFLRNLFGTQVGGPVIKNKLFWFGNYEGYRSREGGTGRAVVPPSEYLKGDFSNLATPIIDPLTRVPFPGNRIPESSFDPFAKTYLAHDLIPAPNQPGQPFNLLGPTQNRRLDDKYIVRVDYAHSDKDKIFGRYSMFDSSLLTLPLIKEGAKDLPIRSQNSILDWVHVFSPRLVGNAKAGINRNKIGTSFPRNALTDPNWPETFGFRNINNIPACNTVTNVAMVGYSGFGGLGYCFGILSNDIHYMYNMNYTTGRHKMGWGAEVRDVNWQQIFNIQGNASAAFGSGPSGSFSGNSVADFLLGARISVIRLAARSGRSQLQDSLFQWLFSRRDAAHPKLLVDDGYAL